MNTSTRIEEKPQVSDKPIKTPRRNLSEEERRDILDKNTITRDSTGKFQKGTTGNPAGRPKKELSMEKVVQEFRDHKNASEIVNKLYAVAMTIDEKKPHNKAFEALKLITERFVPSLRATELKVGEVEDTGFVYLPNQVAPEAEDE